MPLLASTDTNVARHALGITLRAARVVVEFGSDQIRDARVVTPNTWTHVAVMLRRLVGMTGWQIGQVFINGQAAVYRIAQDPTALPRSHLAAPFRRALVRCNKRSRAGWTRWRCTTISSCARRSSGFPTWWQ